MSAHLFISFARAAGREGNDRCLWLIPGGQRPDKLQSLGLVAPSKRYLFCQSGATIQEVDFPLGCPTSKENRLGTTVNLLIQGTGHRH